MKDIINLLENNNKVSHLTKSTIPSLADEIEYKSVCVILNTNRSLFEWAKSFTLKPSEVEGKFNLNLYVGASNPSKTLLAEIYNKCKTKEWEPAKYGHDKPCIDLLVGESEIKQIVNYVYSKLN
jgi:hypothetical protein